MRYFIEIRDENNTPLGQINNFRGLRFNERLNDYGECIFQVPWNDPNLNTLVSLRRYSVHVYKENQRLWAGEQVATDCELRQNNQNWVTITARTWFEMLATRYTSASQVYDQIDAGAIAWALINTSQSETNGDLGFTEGTINATKTRDRKYYNMNIMNAIINLTNVIDGFDFQVTLDKVFNVFARLGSNKPNIALEYGRNILEAQITHDFSNPGNRAIVLGEGFEDTQLRRERNDTSRQATNKIREQLSNEMLVSEVDTLDAKGDAIIRKFRMPNLAIRLTQMPNKPPTLKSIIPGDNIRVRVKTGFYDINHMMRVYGLNVSIGDEGEEYLTYDVGVL